MLGRKDKHFWYKVSEEETKDEKYSHNWVYKTPQEENEQIREYSLVLDLMSENESKKFIDTIKEYTEDYYNNKWVM